MSEKAKQSSALMDKFFECELAPSFIGICVAPFVASASPVLGTALALGATALGCIELKDTIRKWLDPNREKIQKLFENVKFCNSKGEYPKLLKSYKNEYYYFDLPDAMDKRDIMKLKGLLTTSLECDDIRFQINEKPYFMRVIHDKQYGPYSDELFRRVTAPNGEGEYIKINKVDTTKKIYSWGSYKTYQKQCLAFARWLEQSHPEIKSINKAKPSSLKGQYIKSLVVASTMGPGVKLNVTKY